MLRQKCSYGKGIETQKRLRCKEKVELKLGIWHKQVKAKFPARKCWYMMTSLKNMLNS